MQRGVLIKAEQIARLVIQGAKLTRVAQVMGMSYDGLLRITKTEEYKQIEDDIRKQLLGKMDAVLDKRVDIRQQMSDEMEDDAVPEAFRVLIDDLKKRRDLKTALEVLDRDPKRQFAKGAANAKPLTPTVGAPMIDSTALSQAVKEADITHTILETSKKPPAEA